MKNLSLRRGLMATTTICGLLTGVAALPNAASAQQATAPAAAPSKDTSSTEVIVTGSILRKKNLTSISPLTVLGSGDIEKRGATTIESVAQNLAGNNGGAISNNWSVFGFSVGASGLSLRGLTSNSTLVLVDGMRLAYYPLADDATRNFVDLNTIPNAIVDRVEVLQDGASSTYGADAIAGVVNVITRKQFNGFSGKATVGAPEHKGAGQMGVSGTWGTGSLSNDGWNFYLSGEYQKNDTLFARDAGFPYGTADQSSYCGASSLPQTSWSNDTGPFVAGTNIGVNAHGITCRTNGIQNGIQFNDVFAGVGSTTVAAVRPFDSTDTTAMGNWQLLNPALGCGSLTPVTITANQVRKPVAGVPAGTQLCQQDLQKQFATIQPEDTRKSLSAHFIKRFDDGTEAYAEANFYENEAVVSGVPSSIRNQTTPGTAGSIFATNGATGAASNIALPIFICPRGTTVACTGANGTLNPQNPFAAAGNVARINYRFGDIPAGTTTRSDAFRVAAGVKGDVLGWRYNLDITADRSTLKLTQRGLIFAKHLMDVVNDGSYNFMDPSKNTQAVRDYVSPVNVQNSESELVQAQANVSRSLMDLAGGPLQLGLGTSFRYERVANPSANRDPVGGDPANRYFTANPFGAIGFRHVNSMFFELDAPLTTALDVNLGGRMDDYSTGFSAFSPKLSASYKLFDGFTLRGTISKGFRAPSIAENNSDPSTGFISLNAPSDFQNAHGNDGYGAPYALGLTTIAAKDLKPETSEGVTPGAVWQPTRHLGFSFDWYKIHKDKIIAAADFNPAIDAYFAGLPIPTGYQVVAGAPDPLDPTGSVLPGFVIYSLQNLNSQETAGADFAVTANYTIANVKWTSQAEASYIQYYFQEYPDGSRQQYAGTLGNNQITSGSGTPKLRWNWQNTFDFGKASISATTYYVSGYKTVAADNGDDVHAPCEDSSTSARYRDGATIIKCNAKGFAATDLHAQYNLTEHYQILLDISNAFGAKAPYDPSGTYGLTLYNPAFDGSGMMGRYWKLSGKVTF